MPRPTPAPGRKLSQAFVSDGTFSQQLFREATSAQRTRELGDYEAQPPSEQRAGEIIESTDRFVTGVAAMLDG